MATQFTKVTPDEFNTARTQVVSVLGTSTTGTPGATQGYGQTVASSAVAQHQKVTETDLDNLRSDLVKARTHQTGSTPTITNVSKDDKLAAALFNSYTTLASSVSSDKNVIAANQIDTVTRIINTETYAAYEGVAGTGGGWKNNANHTITVTFSSANDARYFFNAGSSFIFSASRTGGTVAPTIGLNQNTSWTNLLSTVTSEAPTFDRPDFYALTNTFSTFYNKNATGTYAANYYRISAKSNVADNSQGGATQIEFKVEFIDAYNDGNTTNYDGVDGTLTSTMVEKSPKGVSSGGALTVNKPFSYTTSPTTGFNESGTPIYITAAYSVTPSPTSVTENSATVNFTFNATNYNTGNTVTFRIIASTTVSLSDFVQTGWTQGPDTIEGYKTLTRTATNTGTFSSSSCSVSIVTNPDALTEGTETFTIEATGTSDGSGGGFPVTATFDVTDSSKTPTPGITVSVLSGAASCIVGEGYDNITTVTYRIRSTPLTGSASLTLYGLFLDLTGISAVSGYKITLPDSTEITPGGNYYTFPTPVVLSPDTNYNVIVSIFSNSGPSGNYTGNLRVRSNGGSADGSGPNTSAPSYNTTSATVALEVIQPTIDFSISTSSTNVNMAFAPGETASAAITLTINNTGNAKGTISGYSVSSSSGGLSVSFNNSLNGVIVPAGGTRTDFVGFGSNTAGTYSITASVTGTNSFTSPDSFSRSDIQVTVQQLFPEISVSATSTSQTVNRQTNNLTVTYTNTGQANLTISNVSITPGTYQDNYTVVSSLSLPAIISPGGSLTSQFTIRRRRIGSSIYTVVVTSNANSNPTFTATGTITGTQSVPSISVTSTNGLVQSSNSFTQKAILKKDSQIYVSVSGLGEIGGDPQILNAHRHPVAAQWEDGVMHQYVIDTTATTPRAAFIVAQSTSLLTSTQANGEFSVVMWSGSQQDETSAWRTGVGVIWMALKTGVFDNGTQSFHNVPGRMGDGSAQDVNQIKVEVEIVPNPKLTVTPTDFVQGDTWQYNVAGCVDNATIYILGTFQDRPNLINTFTEATSQFTSDKDGRLQGGPASSSTVPVGTYIRFVRTKYKNTNYDSSNVTFNVQSPPYFLGGEDARGYPELNGQFVCPTGDPNASPAGVPGPGEQYWFRRTPATNASYLVTVYAFADDTMKVILQGIEVLSTDLPNKGAVQTTVTVTDGYVHWLFRVLNYGGPGYFAAAVYVGTPPQLYRGTGTIDMRGPSTW